MVKIYDFMHRGQNNKTYTIVEFSNLIGQNGA